MKLKTAECVTPRHPDKLCDRISDAILDACLEQDPMSRVAIETMGGHGIITITGELTTKAYINAREIAQRIAGPEYGVQTNIVNQSPFIAQGVDAEGAGDQGIMVGYACSDNEDMIPQELYLARSLCKFIYKKYPYDGKTQITIDANDNDIIAIVASFQNTTQDQLQIEVKEWLREICVYDWVPNTYLNPAGDWSQGGFEADTGVTGRKLAVDNYGPQVEIGGGAFSGKDSTKVDRSGAYMARYQAVTMLKAFKDAKEVKVKLAYAIGVAHPVMATAVVTYKDGTSHDVDIFVEKNKDMFTPQGIIKFLDLRKPFFEETAQWGHFGNEFAWDNK